MKEVRNEEQEAVREHQTEGQEGEVTELEKYQAFLDPRMYSSVESKLPPKKPTYETQEM